MHNKFLYFLFSGVATCAAPLAYGPGAIAIDVASSRDATVDTAQTAEVIQLDGQVDESTPTDTPSDLLFTPIPEVGSPGVSSPGVVERSVPAEFRTVPASDSFLQTSNERPYAYTLGPGDQIQISIFNVPEFSDGNGTYFIPLNGSVQFPWIGSVVLQGLTLNEATDRLTQLYSPYINNPCAQTQACQLLTMQLLQPRPMRVSVTGEVNRPGVYVVGDAEGEFDAQEQTVTSAIQLAGGISQLADVRGIQVYRPQAVGSDVVFPVDFWTLLQKGALEQDLILRDGDRIVVPTASEINNAEITQLATANISPDTIQVNVVGEVDNPGIVDMTPNASMNQAILAAGGLTRPRAKRSRVEFIRLNPDGTVVNRSIPLELEDALNEETNPALRDNDIIIVRRSSLTRISDYLGALTAPLNPLLSIGAIFRLFGN